MSVVLFFKRSYLTHLCQVQTTTKKKPKLTSFTFHHIKGKNDECKSLFHKGKKTKISKRKQFRAINKLFSYKLLKSKN